MSIFAKLIDRRIAEHQSALVETHFDEVELMYQKMRGWRHDYKNHIQLMKTLLAQGDHEAMARYLDALDADLSTIDTVIKTGNKMADAILNSKISLARAKAVPVITEVQIAVALTTPALDLCTVIGNLFDNAIEANLGLPESERLIRVFMEMKGSQLYMSFLNRTAGKKNIKHNERFLSTKGKDRGFGLGRIDAIIEKHHGYINRNSEDGAFTTEILLPQ